MGEISTDAETQFAI